MSGEKTRALFLDRDGVINHEVGYLHRCEDVRWVEGIFELAQTAKSLQYRLVVVTNQSGIARGLYTTEQFEHLMHWMRAEFRLNGASLDGVYHCPYHPTHGLGEWRREHEDRKPGPGMLRRAARDLQLDLAASVMVGDRCSDIAAANAAGLRRAFLLRGTERDTCPGEHLEVDSLGEVAAWLRREAELRTAQPL
jgi:D-glycero-D-manno-heptose 1,7-bisphosphate phosphatase